MVTLSLDSLEIRSLPSTGLLAPLNEFAVSVPVLPQLSQTIGSINSHSVASGFATEGQGADQIAYPRNRQASSATAQTDTALSQYVPQLPNRQGIIAILIGL